MLNHLPFNGKKTYIILTVMAILIFLGQVEVMNISFINYVMQWLEVAVLLFLTHKISKLPCNKK